MSSGWPSAGCTWWTIHVSSAIFVGGTATVGHTGGNPGARAAGIVELALILAPSPAGPPPRRPPPPPPIGARRPPPPTAAPPRRYRFEPRLARAPRRGVRRAEPGAMLSCVGAVAAEVS